MLTNTEQSEALAEIIKADENIRKYPMLWRQYMFDKLAHEAFLVRIKDEREEGREEGKKDAARKVKQQGILTDEQIAQALNMPVEVVASL